MKVVEISEQTKLPLKLVISLAVACFGAASWVTTIYFEQRAQAKQLEAVTRKEEVHGENLGDIKTNVEVIKNDVSYIKKALDKRR